jgi:hypothetical protein
VVSDGQMEPPLAPPLGAFFTPGSGVPDRELRDAVAAEGLGRTTLNCGYNCLLVETPDGQAVDPHLESALEAIRLFGSRLRPFASGEEILWDGGAACGGGAGADGT